MEKNTAKNGFLNHQGGLSEKLDAALEYQKSKGFYGFKLKDGTDYWDEVKCQELVQDGKYKGAKLYKVLNMSRDPLLRAQPYKSQKTGCVLCLGNRHPEDKGVIVGNWEAKANVFPIFKDNHGILVYKNHIEQKLNRPVIDEISNWTQEAKNYRFSFSGENSGASVPDHLHIQFFKTFDSIGQKSPIESFIQNKSNLKLIKKSRDFEIFFVQGYPAIEKQIKVILIRGKNTSSQLDKTIKELEEDNLDYNVLWQGEDIIIFPRTNRGIGFGGDRIIKIKQEKRYLLNKNKENRQRTENRDLAAIEFAGMLVMIDQEQYNLLTYDDFVIILNQLGVKRSIK